MWFSALQRREMCLFVVPTLHKINTDLNNSGISVLKHDIDTI